MLRPEIQSPCLQDAVCNVILAVFLLSGAASAASYSAQWSEPPTVCDDSISSAAPECDQDKLAGMLGGIAVSAILANCYMPWASCLVLLCLSVVLRCLLSEMI